ncbi:MAG: PIN domain-containing protein [Patescibacteria group bacterium]
MKQRRVESICLDTNVILRFLLDDDSALSRQARKKFKDAEGGKRLIYLDEVILAETIWVLLSVYKMEKQEVCRIMTKLLTVKWLVNPRKGLMLAALSLFSKTKLHYPDCWLYTVTNNLGHILETFDLDLMRKVSEK